MLVTIQALGVTYEETDPKMKLFLHLVEVDPATLSPEEVQLYMLRQETDDNLALMGIDINAAPNIMMAAVDAEVNYKRVYVSMSLSDALRAVAEQAGL